MSQEAKEYMVQGRIEVDGWIMIKAESREAAKSIASEAISYYPGGYQKNGVWALEDVRICRPIKIESVDNGEPWT